jgi:hypothetical protein
MGAGPVTVLIVEELRKSKVAAQNRGQFFQLLSNISFLPGTADYFGIDKCFEMTVAELKAKLQMIKASSDDESIRTAVDNMLFAVELDNAWSQEELQEYWQEIEAVEREINRASLLDQLKKRLN